MPKNDDLPWTFLSNHAHVLVCLERVSDPRVRDLAEQVGITERAVIRILRELATAGYIATERVGRRNRYTIFYERFLRHPVEKHRTVGDLLKLLR